MQKPIGHTGTARSIGLVALAAVACGSDGDDVASQHAKWREQRPEQYVIQTCNTGFGGQGCSVRAVDGSSDPDPIEDMFDRVQMTDCDVTTLTFDPTFGFMTEYYLDCSEEGYGSVVRCFVPDTLDTTRCES